MDHQRGESLEEPRMASSKMFRDNLLKCWIARAPWSWCWLSAVLRVPMLFVGKAYFCDEAFGPNDELKFTRKY